jgi:hypothetical protein
LLGQAGESIGIFELLGFDPCRCKLSLDEAEPDVRLETDTHKIKKANRVKTENLIQKCVLGWMSAQGQTVQKRRTKIRATKINMFKVECCGSYGRLPTGKERKKKIC